VESEKDKQENPQADVAQAPNAAPESSTAEPAATPPAAEAASSEAASTDSVSRRRVFIGLGVAAIVIIGAALAMQRTPKEPNTPGSKVTAEITLITSDRTDVDCAAAAGVDKYRCGFSDEATAWNGAEKDKLRPYYTTDRHLFLIPGLFTHPALEARFKSEPPDKPRDLLKRFTAKCELKILGKVGGVKVRWLANGTWGNPEEVEAASVVDCKVEG
jgi:hypothetical protein